MHLDILLAALLILLQVPDIITTNRILALGGRELNPVVRLLMRLGRFWWLPKLVFALIGAVVLALIGDVYSRLALAFLVSAYTLVVASNARQLARRRRRLARWRRSPGLDPEKGSDIFEP